MKSDQSGANESWSFVPVMELIPSVTADFILTQFPTKTQLAP